jgi:hypothetical protein
MDAMEEMAAFKAGKDQRCYGKGTALTENSWTFRSDYMFMFTGMGHGQMHKLLDTRNPCCISLNMATCICTKK